VHMYNRYSGHRAHCGTRARAICACGGPRRAARMVDLIAPVAARTARRLFFSFSNNTLTAARQSGVGRLRAGAIARSGRDEARSAVVACGHVRLHHHHARTHARKTDKWIARHDATQIGMQGKVQRMAAHHCHDVRRASTQSTGGRRRHLGDLAAGRRTCTDARRKWSTTSRARRLRAPSRHIRPRKSDHGPGPGPFCQASKRRKYFAMHGASRVSKRALFSS
jgi:hypothetical protein